MSHRLAMSRRVVPYLDRLAPFRRTIGTTGGLVLATAVNSGTGFIFWLMAARLFPETAVGLAGAAVSAMLLLSQIAVLGLGTALAGVLHREPRPASIAATALVAAGTAGTLLGLVFAIGSPLISSELAPIGGTPLLMLFFAAGVGLTALSAVYDQVMVAVYRSWHQLLRNVIFSFGRLGLLLLAAAFLATQAMAIYGAWAVATAGSLAIMVALARYTSRLSGARPLQWTRLRSMALSALSHHVLNLSRSSSVWILPILVTVVLSREANAAFYVALLIANFVALVGTSATFTLYVVGARDPGNLWRQMRLTLALTAAASVGGSIILAIAGQPILAIFGSSYAAAAFPAVVILGLSTIPLGIKDHWIALQRLRGSVAGAAAIGVVTLSVELGAAALGAVLGGVLGLCVARFAVLLLQAAFMAPSVFAALGAPSVSVSDGPAGRSA